MSRRLLDLNPEDPSAIASGDVEALRAMLDVLHRQLQRGYFSVASVSAAFECSPEEVLVAIEQLTRGGFVEQITATPYLLITTTGHTFRSR